MEKRKILIHLDSDPHASVFDRIVALDSGADYVLSYAPVSPDQVRDFVQGAIFTRGPKDLHSTAIFIGGSDVVASERLLDEVRRYMLPQFGLRVSVLLDANGANTTAAAAVLLASRHLSLSACKALVLGGTGPVGQRVVRLLAAEGARVRVGSRQLARAEAVCRAAEGLALGARLEPAAAGSESEIRNAVEGRELIIAAGAAGVILLPAAVRRVSTSLRVAIDLNAVPPPGIEGVDATDKAVERDGVVCYGALGVGGTKMKIHKAAIAKLFVSNDQIMDAQEVYALARALS